MLLGTLNDVGLVHRALAEEEPSGIYLRELAQDGDNGVEADARPAAHHVGDILRCPAHDVGEVLQLAVGVDVGYFPDSCVHNID